MAQDRLHLLAGGAAKALVRGLEPRFQAETGATIDGVFSAVGAVRDQFVAGAPADVLVLSRTVIDELNTSGLVVAATVKTVGLVRTGVAVPAGTPAPRIGDAQALGAAFAQARAIYIPDPERSTAGIHFMKVLDRLCLGETAGPKLQAFPNGETAMARLAEDGDPGAIGCTQMTEIRMTAGLTLVGPLPGDLDLSTPYVAAVAATAGEPALARKLIDLLIGADVAEMRRACGFEA